MHPATLALHVRRLLSAYRRRTHSCSLHCHAFHVVCGRTFTYSSSHAAYGMCCSNACMCAQMLVQKFPMVSFHQANQMFAVLFLFSKFGDGIVFRTGWNWGATIRCHHLRPPHGNGRRAGELWRRTVRRPPNGEFLRDIPPPWLLSASIQSARMSPCGSCHGCRAGDHLVSYAANESPPTVHARRRAGHVCLLLQLRSWRVSATGLFSGILNIQVRVSRPRTTASGRTHMRGPNDCAVD